MNYFPLTEQLLIETSFLKFAMNAYRAYIYSDEGMLIYHMEQKETFVLSIEEWIYMCKPTQIEGAKSIRSSFALYAVEYAKRRLFKDWEDFQNVSPANTKQQAVNVRAFLTEINTLRTSIPKKDYLAPIAAGLYEVLDRIEKHYHDFSPSSAVEKDMKNQETARIVWSADKTVLYAIIRDLNTKELPSGDRYLSASSNQIAKLIVENFITPQGNFEFEDVKRYFTNKPRHIARKILLDFSLVED